MKTKKELLKIADKNTLKINNLNRNEIQEIKVTSYKQFLKIREITNLNLDHNRYRLQDIFNSIIKGKTFYLLLTYNIKGDIILQ